MPLLSGCGRWRPDLFFKMKYPDNSTSTPDEKQRIMDYIHRRDELRPGPQQKKAEIPFSLPNLCPSDSDVMISKGLS